jgi:hypothetical protein
LGAKGCRSLAVGMPESAAGTPAARRRYVRYDHQVLVAVQSCMSQRFKIQQSRKSFVLAARKTLPGKRDGFLLTGLPGPDKEMQILTDPRVCWGL